MKEGIRLYHAKRYDKALEFFIQMPDDPTENADLSYYIGLCYTQLGRYEEALAYLEQAVVDESNFLHIYQCRLILAYIYTITRRQKMAEFELKKMRETGFESPQVFSLLGFALYSQKKVKESLEALKEALNLDADNSNALNSIGYIHAEENLDLDYALDCCKRAVRLRPRNAAYLDSLGWCLFKRGDAPGARTVLRRALDLAPGNKEIATHLRAVLNDGK